MSKREELEQAIATLEAQRAILGDVVVDASVEALRRQLANLDEDATPGQQRKQVTILVLDVVGSTSMIGQLDPEDNLALMDTALSRLSEPVNRRGGRVTRYTGDGFLALFGHPTASENDPDNAVLAALDMLEEAQRYRAEVAARWERPDFNIRIGIDSGLMVVGGESEGENTLAGTAVNLATRLETAAETGTVLISHNTYQLVRGVFDLTPVEPVQAKGFSRPVRAYQVHKAKARSFRTRRRGVEGIETRLIGRQSEIDALRAAYATVVGSKERKMVTLVGEAGLGKSRMLYEFENWVDLQPEDITLFRGRARQETKHLPNSLFRDLFAFRLGLQEDDSPDRIAEKFVAGFAEVFDDGATDDPTARVEVEKRAHIVGHMLGFSFQSSLHIQSLLDDPRQLRARALVYMTDYFKMAATSWPLLVLLEDLHWADESSLEILTRLTLALRERPALILAAARPEFFERQPDWMAGQPFHLRLDLAPLSTEESRLLAREVLQKVDDLPVSLHELIVTNAEGNPFFVEELVKMLIEEGVILTGEQSWQVIRDRLYDLDVPPTLTGVLQARLDALSVQERAILQRASVVGRVFWEQAVCYLNPAGDLNLDDAIVSHGLNVLQSREMVFPRELSAFRDTSEHIFKHALLRDVTYESVLKQARKQYHSLAADWLIERGDQRAGELSSLIADHLEQAGRVSEALGYLREAGAQAANAYANEEAIKHYSQAINLLPANEVATRVELLLARVPVLGLRGDRVAQEADLQELEQLAQLSDDPQIRLLIALEKASYAYDVADFRAALGASEEAVHLAGELGDLKREILGRRMMGLTLTQLGAYEAAEACLMISLRLSRETGDERGEGLISNTLGPVAAAEGEFERARGYYERAVALAIRSGDRFLEGAARNNLGTVAKYLGDFSGSMGHFDQARLIAEDIGDRQGEAIALMNSGVIAADLGLFPTAEENYSQALSIARDIGDRRVERISLGNLGGVALLMQSYDESHRYYRDALEIAQELNDRSGEGYMLDGLCAVTAELGDLPAALDLGRQAIRIREEIGQTHLALESRAQLASVELAAGNAAAALALVEEILSALETGETLDGTDEPQLILWRCIQVLRASNDPRWKDLLETAHTRLLASASKIQGEALRHSFLDSIPWNQEILQLWEATLSTSE